MKLRVQVLFLGTLQVVLPIMAFMGFLSLETSSPLPGKVWIQNLSLNAWVADNLSRGPLGSPAIRPGAVPFPDFDFVLMDRANTVILSRQGGRMVPAGTSVDLAEMKARYPHKRLIWVSLVDKGGIYGSYAVLLDNALGTQTSVLGVERIVFFFALVLATGLGLSLWMRKMVQTVLQLRETARLLGDGVLERPVKPIRSGVQEFRELATAIEVLRKGLLSEKQKRGLFLAGISHDLMTPLTSIRGYMEAIQDGLARDPQTMEKYLAIIGDKAILLESRVQALLDYSRMDAREWVTRFEPAPLLAFLKRVAQPLPMDAELLGKVFVFEVSGPDVVVRFDPLLTQRALENLLFNALKYTPEHGKVTFTAVSAGDLVVLEIADEGPGIAPEDHALVFEPFYRGGAQGGKEGAGLGLFIAKTIFDAQGWDLSLDPRPGAGTLFRIRVVPQA